MFRASPWISYEPPTTTISQPMDAPEISTLREEEEETPPPEGGGLSFSKFRVNLRAPARSSGNAAATASSSAGSIIGPPLGPPSANRAIRAPSPPDSDDEDEEDQLIDDDELPIVSETGRPPPPATHSSANLAALRSSPALSASSPRKRGAPARSRQRRGVTGGRRGRPGREPPDAAAMMSTFELAKADEPGSSSASLPPPPLPLLLEQPPQVVGPPSGDWPSNAPPPPPPKPARKRPGPKKGSTLGPRGPRKNAAHTPGTATPIIDQSHSDASFLVPAPSIPPTPGSDPNALSAPHLSPIIPPDLEIDVSVPVPVYPLPTRSFPVQAPPKVPSGYATTHPIDTSRTPVRKWRVAQREIKGIAGGRWFARCWVGDRDKDADTYIPPSQPSGQKVSPPDPSPPPPSSSSSRPKPPSSSSLQQRQQKPPSSAAAKSQQSSASRPPAWTADESELDRQAESRPLSRESSVKPEVQPHHPLSDSETQQRWPPQPTDGGLSSRGPASPHTRSSVSPTPPSPPPHLSQDDGPS